jgi:hypothetical protein
VGGRTLSARIFPYPSKTYRQSKWWAVLEQSSQLQGPAFISTLARLLPPPGFFSQQSPVIPYRLHLRPLMMFTERKPLWGFLGIQPRRVVSATQWKLHHFSKCSRISFAYCGDVVHRRGPTTMGTMVMPILSLALAFTYTQRQVKGLGRRC